MPRYDTKYIGENIKAIRKKNKLSQKQLADLVGVSQAAIYYYESGKRDINMVLLSKIANALNVHISDFFQSEPKKDKMDLLLFACDEEYSTRIANNIKRLNLQGQEKLYNYSCDLLEIEKYRAKDTPKQETTPPEQNNTAPDELLAAHQRTDIEPTEEGLQHDLDIMNDESKWD